MTEPKTQDVELIPKSTAEKLDAHANLIQTAIDGERKGVAEFFGYAFLVGKRLLAAKAELPHGNEDHNAGFKRWVEANFKRYTHRTATNRMSLALALEPELSKLLGNKAPLLLGAKKLAPTALNTVLKAVGKVMDGKTMTEMMRAGRILRDPEKQKHHARKEVSAQEANKAKCKQAKRVWDRITGDLELAGKIAARIEDVADLKRYLEATVEAGNKIRTILKKRQGEAK